MNPAYEAGFARTATRAVKQAAPALPQKKPCGGCGKAAGPMRVARQETKPQAAPSRPWIPSPLDGHFNGSIIEWQGKLVLCTRKGRVNSRLWITHLKDDLTPASHPVELKIAHERCNGGQEDPRLFVQGGRLCVAFCGVETLMGKTTTWQMVAELDAAFQARRVTALQLIGRTWPMEKNWVPFVEGDELRMVYAVEPRHQVLAIENGRAERLPAREPGFSWEWGQVRGGAAPVRVGDEWYHWFHATGQQGGRPYYTAGLYTFEARAPYRVRRFIPEPLLEGDRPNDEGKRVVFPCGAILKDGKWIVSYGWNDVAVRFASFDQEKIERRLLSVG